MAAYYNEIDPFAAEWLRNLISAGLIAPGEVDERSIEEVAPDDLRGFVQCHFFAGIGVWSYALRMAGWPDDRPIWTGSCPCQPFSAAGKKKGTSDDRHLWPAWFSLIRECRPGAIVGEQVASKDGLAWLDIVSADLETADYAWGAADLCAAGVGAPHIRQRLFFGAYDLRSAAGWMGDSDGAGSQGRIRMPGGADQRAARPAGLAGGLAHADGGDASTEGLQRSGQHGRRTQNAGPVDGPSGPLGEGQDDPAGPGEVRPGPTNGFWRDADWLFCRDGKWRAVEPGTFPLAHGAPARVGRLRGYGNAIVAPLAEAFIAAFAESLPVPVENDGDLLT